MIIRDSTPQRPIEERLREYVDVNSEGLATVRELLNQGRLPAGPNTDALRTMVDFWDRIAGDLEKIIDGDELEHTVGEFVV